MLRKLLTHQSAMFVVGATGFLHDVFWHGTERPFMLALSGALMGLPFVLAADKVITRTTREEEKEDLAERWSHLE